MKNINMKNVKHMLNMELKIHKKTIIYWSIALFSVMAMYMFMFSMVKDLALEKMNALGPEFLAMFGIESFEDITNFNYYFAMVFQIVIVVISIHAVLMASNSLHKEETSGTIEFIYSQPVNRLEIYISKLLFVYIRIIALLLFSVLGGLISGYISSFSEVNFLAILMVFLLSLLTASTFLGAGFLISSIIKKNKRVGGLAVAVFFIPYIIGYLSELLGANYQFLTYFSPIQSLSTSNSVNIILKNTSLNIWIIILWSALSITLPTVGYMFYKKKDLQ